MVSFRKHSQRHVQTRLHHVSSLPHPHDFKYSTVPYPWTHCILLGGTSTKRATAGGSRYFTYIEQTPRNKSALLQPKSHHPRPKGKPAWSDGPGDMASLMQAAWMGAGPSPLALRWGLCHRSSPSSSVDQPAANSIAPKHILAPEHMAEVQILFKQLFC